MLLSKRAPVSDSHLDLGREDVESEYLPLYKCPDFFGAVNKNHYGKDDK